MGSPKKPLTNKKGDVRELTAEDFADALSFDELPQALQNTLISLKKRGRPKLANRKQVQTFKLSPDVIEDIKASGKGYNARVEAVLRAAIADGRI